MSDNYLDEEEEPKSKLSPIPFILAIVILGISFSFRLLHWPGGSLFHVIGALLFIIYSFYGMANPATRSPMNIIFSVLSAAYVVYFLTIK